MIFDVLCCFVIQFGFAYRAFAFFWHCESPVLYCVFFAEKEYLTGFGTMVKIVAVGRVKERYLQEGIAEFVKRLGAFDNIGIVEVKDSTVEEEGETLLKAAGDDYVVALSICGKEMSSEEFASFVKKNSEKKICYVIGGPEGLSEKVLERADYSLSLSRMTFTHEMARFFLLEQIYRAHMINAKRKYHK
jgi:23S rRNA (pseudouridine1915-N3)-methyltransferase